MPQASQNTLCAPSTSLAKRSSSCLSRSLFCALVLAAFWARSVCVDIEGVVLDGMQQWIIRRERRVVEEI